MRILVTGANGFIGAALLRLAINRNHEVAGLIRPGKTPTGDLANSPRLQWLHGTLDDAPWKEIEVFQPDVCVHTAWISAPKITFETPENHNYLEWSKAFLGNIAARGTKRILSVGTCIEYQLGNHLLSEERTPLAPQTLYAKCKNELRLALEDESRARGFSLCWARVFYAYGVGEHPDRLCTSIIRRLGRDEKIILQTPESTKDYIYVDDVASGLMTALEKNFTGPLNICTGVGVTVRDVARTLATKLGKPELVEEKPGAAADPLGYVVGDSSRLRGLGWRPQFTLERGLERMVEAAAG